MSNMSRTRPLSMSNGNRDRIPRYDRNSVNSQSKSALRNSPPRIFIKPRIEASSASASNNNKFARRASFIAVPTKQQRDNQQALTASTRIAPRRSSSLHHTANIPYNAPPSKLPRSSTVVRHANAKLVVDRGASGDPGSLVQPSTIKIDKTETKKVTRASSPKKNKENEAIPRGRPPIEMHPKPKRVFTRKQSPLVPDDLRTSQLFPRKTFLLPKLEEDVPKPEVTRCRPRRSTVHSTTPREKNGKIIKKKSSLPSLPTMVITHTPRSATNKLEEQYYLDAHRTSTPLKFPKPEFRQAILSSASGTTPRPFLLPRRASTIPSSSSLNSILSLPSQVLKHTPLASQLSGSASGSPCLSKARTKTIWTMLDEMNLIRSGGLLAGVDSLAPDSGARIVPLCKRLRNAPSAIDSPKDVPALKRTPVRSSSTPYHLLVSSARRSRTGTPSALPPLPSIKRALAHAHSVWEENTPGPKGSLKKKAIENEKYNWTLVDMKKPQRRSTVSSPIGPVSGGAGYGPGIEGYGVCIRTHDVTQRPKPSLLTRAQTLMKFKFSGSKRVVGRGDPKWA